MKKKLVLLLLGLGLFVNTAALAPRTASAQSGCAIVVNTPTVNPGESVNITINNAPNDPSADNTRYHIWSPRTDRWIDVGNIVKTGGTVQLSILNDNNGNSLFVEGTIGNTIVLRRWDGGPFYTNLCTAIDAVFVRVSPVEGGLICDACDIDSLCDPAFQCIQFKCIPRTGGLEGDGCLNNQSCSSTEDLRCNGSMTASEWCAEFPGSYVDLPGVCTPNETEPVVFNCSNRGGQCSTLTFEEEACLDNIIQSDCDLFGLRQCWIHPTSATGLPIAAGLRGSCVTGNTAGCGSYGQSCCQNDGGAYYCDEGSPEVQATPGLTYCWCGGGEIGLGGSCTDDSQCLSGHCNGGTCSLSTQCIQAPEGATEVFCENAGGILCDRAGDTVDIDGALFCCPTSGLCRQLGGVPAQNNPLCSDGTELGIDTAIGCIPLQLVQSTTRFFIQWGLSVGGGIALFLIAVAGFMFATSSGDPKKLENSKALFFSSIGGLLMIVLSVFLLRFVGVNILGLFS